MNAGAQALAGSRDSRLGGSNEGNSARVLDRFRVRRHSRASLSVCHISRWTQRSPLCLLPLSRGERDTVFALSQGERVDRDRRFYQPARTG